MSTRDRLAASRSSLLRVLSLILALVMVLAACSGAYEEDGTENTAAAGDGSTAETGEGATHGHA